MNDITLKANLSVEPNIYYTKNGNVVANFQVIENVFAGYDENHKRITKPNYYSVVMFGEEAEKFGNTHEVGRLYIIKGEMIPNNYEANGQMHYGMKLKAEYIKPGPPKKDKKMDKKAV